MHACRTQRREGASATNHENLSCQIKFEINHFDIISSITNIWGNWKASMAIHDANDTNIPYKEYPIESCIHIL
jgi:hypothetical protein